MKLVSKCIKLIQCFYALLVEGKRNRLPGLAISQEKDTLGIVILSQN